MDIRPPVRIETERCIIRRWTVDDAPALHEAVVASTEHLRPWMPWIEHEPLTVEQRRELIETWTRQWDAGEDFVLGILDRRDDTVLGGTGFHCRLGPDALEIGYWIHVDRAGQGLATETSRALTAAALQLPSIESVVIRHDRANVRSAAVPRKLGYAMEREVPDEITAPGEEGMSWWWRARNPGWFEAQ